MNKAPRLRYDGAGAWGAGVYGAGAYPAHQPSDTQDDDAPAEEWRLTYPSTMTHITPNPDGIRKVYDEIARKIEGVDQGVRRDSEGSSAEDVEALAGQRFSAIGVQLPEADLQRYAAAVVAGEPFEFRLQ